MQDPPSARGPAGACPDPSFSAGGQRQKASHPEHLGVP